MQYCFILLQVELSPRGDLPQSFDQSLPSVEQGETTEEEDADYGGRTESASPSIVGIRDADRVWI